MNAYIVFKGKQGSIVTTNKRRAITFARKVQADEVRAMPYSSYRYQSDPYGWDYPTFRVLSQPIWARDGFTPLS